MNFCIFIFSLVAVVLVSGTLKNPDIIDGNDVENIEDAPFMLSLRHRGKHICGAVVIGNRWALTAAQCVRNRYFQFRKFFLTVHGGSVDRNNGGFVSSVKTVKMHSLSKRDCKEYDLALIGTRDNFPSWILDTPLRLPLEHEEPEGGDIAFMYGWGKIGNSKELSDGLQVGEAYVFDRRNCDSLDPANRDAIIGDARLFCAAAAGVAPCVGDIGGPLIIDDILIGIIADKEACENPFHPTVYANLGHENIRSWIKSTIMLG